MQHARGTYLFCAGGLAVSWAWYSTNVSFSASLISEAYESLRGRGHFFALFCNPNRRIRFFMVNHTKGKAPTTGFFSFLVFDVWVPCLGNSGGVSDPAGSALANNYCAYGIQKSGRFNETKGGFGPAAGPLIQARKEMICERCTRLASRAERIVMECLHREFATRGCKSRAE